MPHHRLGRSPSLAKFQRVSFSDEGELQLWKTPLDLTATNPSREAQRQSVFCPFIVTGTHPVEVAARNIESVVRVDIDATSLRIFDRQGPQPSALDVLTRTSQRSESGRTAN